MARGPIREHTGISLGIAGILVTFFVILPVLIVVTVYSFLTVYAIVKAIGSAPDSAGALTVLLGVVAIVTLFTSLLGAGIALVGRSLDPKNRPLRKLAFLRRRRSSHR
jgi:ABC-type sulfate transport system permease component